MDVTKQSFFEGIKMAKAGNHLHQISAAINDYVDQFGYGVIWWAMESEPISMRIRRFPTSVSIAEASSWCRV